MRNPQRHEGFSPTRGCRLAACGWVLLAAACSEAGADGGAADVVRHDSAGIAIVETTRAAWADGVGWTIDPDPELVIGALEGEDPYIFGELRGAVRLENGSVVAVDNQAREVRWFDSAGGFVRGVGGPGEGPTEFPRSAYQLERCGPNRLYVHDLWARRVLVWDTAGEFQRGFELVEPGNAGRRPYNAGCRDDGGFVAIGWGYDSGLPSLPESQEALTYRQDSPMWALDSLGRLELELGSFLSSERILHHRGSGPHPFGRAAKFAAGGDRVFIGTGEGLAVLVYRMGGTSEPAAPAAAAPAATERAAQPTQIWRARTADLAIGAALLDAYADADLGPRGDERTRRWVLDGVVESPPELPAYTELQVSPDGHLWVKRYVPPWQTQERWGVFAPDGAFLGNVEFPPRLWVTEIGNEHIVGVATDELGVERVHVYRIRKRGAASG